MKMQLKILFPLALSLISFSSCQSDTDPSLNTYPENARLIRVLHYVGNQAQDYASIEEYEYDGDGRLIKTSRPMYKDGERAGISGYDEYEYDLQDRLTKISSFNYNINGGFINIKNVLYTYDSEGIKEKETIEYPNVNSSEEIIFHHDGKGRLMLQEHFNPNKVSQAYHIFEYNAQDQLIEEKIYDADQRLIRKHIHDYENGNNTEIKVYVGDTDEILRKITKTFDRNKNLVLLQSEELSIYSSSRSYIHRYEYE